MRSSLDRILRNSMVRVGLTCTLFILTGAFTQQAHAAKTPPISKVKLKDNATTTKRGRIDGGKQISLKWASQSGTACFPATRNNFYNGKHVLYEVAMPPHSQLEVELVPAKGVDLSLYGYQTGTRGKLSLPPSGAGSPCEASAMKGNRKYGAKHNPGMPEVIKLTAIRNPYRVVVGVAGSNGALKGQFKINFKLKVAPKDIPNTGPPPISKVKLKDNATTTKSGRIDGGKQISLKWASQSGTACFPGTRNNFYNGKHVLYEVAMPPHSQLEVELVPAKGVDLSLYGYQTGTRGKLSLPPSGAGSPCEASAMKGNRKYGAKHNPGMPEVIKLTAIRNPYRVVVGVAGSNGALKGQFKLKMTLKKR